MVKETKEMKKANELEAGDKLKAGTMIAEIKSVRLEVRGSAGEIVKHFTLDGQPEIAAWNLQKFIDQGSIEIL